MGKFENGFSIESVTWREYELIKQIGGMTYL